MRLFIAIQLTEGIKNAIDETQARIRQRGVAGNYTPSENLHLTLAFIGEYSDPDRVLEIITGMPFEPFEMTIQGIGSFGDLWWVGVEASQAMNDYVRRLRYALAEACIPFDRKRFSPHITILRRASLDLHKQGIQAPEGISMIADHASLMRSDRGRSGMIYTEIL